MSRHSDCPRCLILAGALAFSAPALADQYHYNEMLVGDRAAGMGGAYVAVADDPTGLYYNPAGIVYSGKSSLSASMNAINISRTEYKNVLNGKDWIRTSSALIPNFFGVSQPLGPGTVGFSYAVTDAVLEDQDQSFANVRDPGDEFTINFNNQDTSYNLGPSYALALTPRLSLGLTLYGFIRQRQMIFNQMFQGLSDPVYVLDSDGKRIPDPDNPGKYLVETDPDSGEPLTQASEQWENQYLQTEEYGIRPLLGLMWSPVDKLSLGLAVSKIQLLYASSSQQVSCYSTDYDGMLLDENDNPLGVCRPREISKSTVTSSVKRNFPWAANLGAAYFASDRLLLSGAAWIYQGMNGQSNPVVNYALGLEYYLTGRFALRLGAYSNQANTPPPRSGGINQAEHVNLRGASFSLTHFTRSSSITLGMAAARGRGQGQVISNSTSIQDIEVLNFAAFLSAGYSY